MKKGKHEKGQFYTLQHSCILKGFCIPETVQRIVEPFAGQGDLIEWIRSQNTTVPIEAYDIDPKTCSDCIIQVRDTLLNPPDYAGAYVITNPPYLARNKASDKSAFDKYGTNDLYKCFLSTLQGSMGGILILPVGFFLSVRPLDEQCRHLFLSRYRIDKLCFFEKPVFSDTTSAIVSFQYTKSDEALDEQTFEWIFDHMERRTFTIRSDQGWMVGGEIYNIVEPAGIRVRRHVVGLALDPGEQQTFITLRALDTGGIEGRIGLEYREGYIYPGIHSARTHATLRVRGIRELNEEDQKQVVRRFNEWIEEKREQWKSLFLPHYREYDRKRMPFDLAYRIVAWILEKMG